MSKPAPSWLKGFAGKRKEAAKESTPSFDAKKAKTAQEEGEGIEDYMADHILPQDEASSRRRVERNTEKTRPLKERMSEALDKAGAESGLSNPIGNDNIGFRLGLGKEKSGLAAPLDIHMKKASRRGLGVEEETRRIAQEQARNKAENVSNLKDSFLSRQKANFETKQNIRDLSRAQKVCETLDRAAGLENPQLWGISMDEDGKLAGEEAVEQRIEAPDGSAYSRVVSGRPQDRSEMSPEDIVSLLSR
ncbi:hypothetical protein GUITHDRAFT_116144 [Guillardia theta CCMP2712]|uniref:Uncharacterized protein n=1 Tax=Guillardia theta (strain CCMP2712) TaxID=905079 RepID=L1INL7_GUITC|nr:hypothetical protein GUITHDRAFT_116144 [Guillardia theta CCMP2712]EKX37667.1 hypothetical protein GUITHDRAFT_116144 [Guillardia theta CCMP2712]|eukprot:XP_005824647.1 hypothetical protein GUITHDRAFT_116144 [Guillardia theta CCMP2712]